MVFHRALAKIEVGSDVLAGMASENHFRDLALTRRQPREVVRNSRNLLSLVHDRAGQSAASVDEAKTRCDSEREAQMEIHLTVNGRHVTVDSSATIGRPAAIDAETSDMRAIRSAIMDGTSIRAKHVSPGKHRTRIRRWSTAPIDVSLPRELWSWRASRPAAMKD